MVARNAAFTQSKHTITILVPFLLLAAPAVRLHAGQAALISLDELVGEASLVAVVDVNKVTKVDVATGDNTHSSVFVAEAQVLETLKSDISPVPEKRRIAIVGSTIPNSSAVWRPIESRRYLAFLKREQGHYRYGWRFALREIDEEGRVEWYQQNDSRKYEFLKLKLNEAIKRIRSQ